jgi:NAD-dependent deacetylase sirtuin 5
VASSFKKQALASSIFNKGELSPARGRFGSRTMASATLTFPSSDVESFRQYLEESDRILALLGAGLSASSGLPTFRGSGGIWRNNEAVQLATPEAFRTNPGLVWQFYSYRRHMALAAQPNKAHYALAELARKKPNFQTLSQNVDGMPDAATQAHLMPY